MHIGDCRGLFGMSHIIITSWLWNMRGCPSVLSTNRPTNRYNGMQLITKNSGRCCYQLETHTTIARMIPDVSISCAPGGGTVPSNIRQCKASPVKRIVMSSELGSATPLAAFGDPSVELPCPIHPTATAAEASWSTTLVLNHLTAFSQLLSSGLNGAFHRIPIPMLVNHNLVWRLRICEQRVIPDRSLCRDLDLLKWVKQQAPFCGLTYTPHFILDFMRAPLSTSIF